MSEDEGKKEDPEAIVDESPGEAPAKKSESYLIWLLFAAVLGRWVLQTIPSVEPVIPLTVLAALILGANSAAIVGVIGYVVSDFLIGLPGPWTLFYAFAAIIVAYVSGLWAKKGNISSNDYLLLVFIGTIIFQAVVAFIFGTPDIAYVISSSPFVLLHIVSNLVFAVLLSGFVKKD